MKKVAILLVVCVMFLSACGAEPVEITTVANYQERQVELLEADFFTTDDGESRVRVSVQFTNNDDQGLYLLESFAVRAYQNNVEIDFCFGEDVDDSLTRAIRKGQSITSAYVFEIRDDSPVTVQICTPTADEVLLAEREYSK